MGDSPRGGSPAQRAAEMASFSRALCILATRTLPVGPVLVTLGMWGPANATAFTILNRNTSCGLQRVPLRTLVGGDSGWAGHSAE